MFPKILIVKTTSMGDIIHALPAIHDIRKAMPKAQIDWLVEDIFADIPALSRDVNKIHKVAVRRWRKSLFSSKTRQEIAQVKKAIEKQNYDCVIDLQGLLKSAWMARWANAPICGFDSNSIREPVASWFYKSKYAISKSRTAIDRSRALCAKALGYEYDGTRIRCDLQSKNPLIQDKPYVAFLVNTSRDSKLWPEEKWIALGVEMVAKGFQVHFLWAGQTEKLRVERIAQAIGSEAIVHPRLTIAECADVVASAALIVGVDTGLTHLADAMGRPGVALFLDSPAELVGLQGERVRNLGGMNANPSVPEVLTAIEEVLS